MVPDGAQDGQAALRANGAEQGQALEVAGPAVKQLAMELETEWKEVRSVSRKCAVWKVRERKPALPG